MAVTKIHPIKTLSLIHIYRELFIKLKNQIIFNNYQKPENNISKIHTFLRLWALRLPLLMNC